MRTDCQGTVDLICDWIMGVYDVGPEELAEVDFTKAEASGKYVCSICGYVYDPAEHDGVAFADLPEDWKCPCWRITSWGCTGTGAGGAGAREERAYTSKRSRRDYKIQQRQD